MTIRLTLAKEKDCEYIYEQRTEREVMKTSKTKEEFSYESHKNWYEETLRNANRNLFIILNSIDAIGYIRFDKRDCTAKINIVIDKDSRGKGLGTEAIKESCKQYFNNFWVFEIIAEIEEENLKSVKAFEKAGFVLKKYKSSEGILEYSLIK